MNDKPQTRSPGICWLAWSVVVSNILLFAPFFSPRFGWVRTIEGIRYALSLAAVFPAELFDTYFSGFWIVPVSWMMVMVLCGFGILFLNKFARAAFIILIICHNVVLGYLVVDKVNHPLFLDYFFKRYFHFVVAVTYIGFLTLYEVRKQFKVDLEGLRLQIFLTRPLQKKLTIADGKRYRDLSVAYMRLERFSDALDALSKALSVDPNNPDLYFRQGLIYLRLKDRQAARGSFQKTVALDPIHYEANYNLGALCMAEGSAREAAEYFLKATHIQPSHSQTYRDLGDAYAAFGEYRAACEAYQWAIKNSWMDSYSYFRWGSILARHLDDPEGALEKLRTAVRLDPQQIEAQIILGETAMALGRFKDAVRAFKTVAVLKGDDAKVVYLLGMAYLKLGDRHSAERVQKMLGSMDEGLAQELLLAIQSL